MSNTILFAVQDDLNSVLEELLKKEKPSKKNISQLEYDISLLNDLIEKTNDVDEAHEISNIIKLVERVVKTYKVEPTSPIKIKLSNKKRLKRLGTSGDTYDSILEKLMNSYDKNNEEK